MSSSSRLPHRLTETGMKTPYQLSLLHVLEVYKAHPDEPLSNAELYTELAEGNLSAGELNKKIPIGRSKAYHSPLKRKIRWYQQTLKQLGLVQRINRGSWQLANKNKAGLHIIPQHLSLIGFSTRLGLALWSNASIFRRINEAIHLCITSPPYPLKQSRKYGNAGEMEWVDFVCRNLEPIVRNLHPGASIILNVSNDIFEPKRPSRSLYVERLMIALYEKLGLHLMDRIPWINKSKPPGPTYWACIQHFQLAVAWEPILWLTNDPASVRADNQRVMSLFVA